MKRLMQFAVVLVVSLCFVVNANAAVNQKLMDYAKGKVSQADMTRIERFLTQNEVSDADADKIIAKADQIQKILKDANVKSYEELSKAKKQEVFSLAQEAAAIVGATLTYDNSNKVVEVKDAKGNVYDVQLNPYLKTTGSSNMIYVASASGVVLVGVAAAIYRKKRNA